MSNTAIELSGIVKSYGKKQVLTGARSISAPRDRSWDYLARMARARPR